MPGTYISPAETSLYYLQTRYYNPGTGRFINADVLTSTGQGLLGNNMFAYCLNNPAMGYDPHGTVVLPILSLLDYYAIHKMVQCLIVDSHGYAMEVYVISPYGSGRLDLFDATNNQYYEVKHAPLASKWDGSYQKKKYDNSVIGGEFFKIYYFDEPLSAGWNMSISGQFEYKYWDITYEAKGNGLITYTARLNKKRYFEHLKIINNVTTVIACAAWMGYASSWIQKQGTGRYQYNIFESE